MADNLYDTDILISKFLAGEATPEEAMQLEDWKMESDANLEYYQEAEKLFLLSANDSHPAEINVSAAWKKVSPQLAVKTQAKIIRPNFSFMRIAASFLLLIGIGGMITYFINSDPSGEKIYTAQAPDEKVRLSDGTKVIMASGSSVSMDQDYGKKNRLVHLKGSAYFTVKHDEQKPFIIDAGDLFIKDLGTKFNVAATYDTIHVRVDEGIVSMYERAGKETILHAGESAYYLKSKHEIVVKKPYVSASIKLDFVNRKLSEVVQNLNQAYGTHIELQNNALADCRITTNFKDENLEIVLTVITETLGLKFQKSANGYIIQGEKCDK